MARTNLTPLDVPANYATDGAAVTFTAADAVNGNRFKATGRELLLARNVGASAATVTIASAADPYGRTGDITADSLAADEIHVYPFFPLAGWADASGYINVNGSAVDIEFAVLRLPR